MTNEQHIENLKKLKSFHIHNGNYDPDIDRAIKALEQEPCEDVISRQAVLECFTWTNDKADIWNRIKELSPVTSQPKTGHWIMSEDGLYRPICDKCGTHPWKGYIPTVEEATEVFKYCPNCGAKMVEPQERSGEE